MNRSFSKIRHIEKSNILLEQRYNPKVPEDEMDDTNIFLYKKILRNMASLKPKKFRDSEEFMNELEIKAEKLISRYGDMILSYYETQMNRSK